jgi:HD-like signal output (HDOD) protein
LLAEIKDRHPHTVRIATSGAAHRSVIVRALEVAHQFLPKPLEATGLKAALARSASFRERVTNDSVRRLIADLRTIPSLPGLYQELVAALQSPQASVETAAAIISQDMAMVTKILQVVNSAYFSLRRTISSPGHAIALLGIDTIKSLVLSLQVFSQFSPSAAMPVSIEALWRHGMATGSSAKAIAKTEGVGALGVEGAFIGGLVHDIGVLVLGANFPEQYREVLRISREQRIAVWAAEQDVFGASHCEVAGYLLGLWGLNEAVVEAVLYHHDPPPRAQQSFSVHTAVYAANGFDEANDETVPAESRTPLDAAYFEACGLTDRVESWRNEITRAA